LPPGEHRVAAGWGHLSGFDPELARMGAVTVRRVRMAESVCVNNFIVLTLTYRFVR